MSTVAENNKRIAKNTVALYIRMLLVMAVSLYTSRVILNVLGVDDFGIYNLVAGVVVLFSFLNNAMTSASQRYLNVAIGQNDKDEIQRVFSSSLIMHLSLIVIVLLLAESIGLWFVETKLNIPEGRETAAFVAYQLAIVTTCINILKVPYNASVIANEKMSFFAYTGIVEVILKLLIVWILLFFESDKLIVYSVLLLLVNLILLIWYIIYCRRHFDANQFNLSFDKILLKEMSSFSGWNLFGGVADVGYKQGTHFILNIFCGVALNATMGIINQIRTAIFSFTSNLQVAANPQIIKSYTTGDYSYYQDLVFRISKYSYFLMLLICVPVILNADYLLHLWLKNPPEYTTSFTILILIFCLVDSLTGPLWTSMQATGNIRIYQIATSLCLLLNLPLSFLVLKMGMSPEWVIIVQILVALFNIGIRIFFSHKYANISALLYVKKVLLPITLVTVLSLPLSIWLSYDMSDFIRMVVVCLMSPTIIITLIYFCGTSKIERNIINKYLLSRFKS